MNALFYLYQEYPVVEVLGGSKLSRRGEDINGRVVF